MRCDVAECWDCGFADDDMGCSIYRIPTVTKADICREFAKKVQEYLLRHKKLVREIETNHIYEAVKIEFISDIDRVLAEMEKE